MAEQKRMQIKTSFRIKKTFFLVGRGGKGGKGIPLVVPKIFYRSSPSLVTTE